MASAAQNPGLKMKWVGTAQPAGHRPALWLEGISSVKVYLGPLLSLPPGQQWPQAWLSPTLMAALDLLELQQELEHLQTCLKVRAQQEGGGTRQACQSR